MRTRRAMNAWAEHVEQAASKMRALRAAASAMRRRPLKAGMNSWRAYAIDCAAAARVTRRAASAFSPTKMAMRKALNRWADVWLQRRSLRRAVA